MSQKDPYGNFPCDGSLPGWRSCMENGNELAEWMLQRWLNPKNVCDWEKGMCDSGEKDVEPPKEERIEDGGSDVLKSNQATREGLLNKHEELANEKEGKSE